MSAAGRSGYWILGQGQTGWIWDREPARSQAEKYLQLAALHLEKTVREVWSLEREIQWRGESSACLAFKKRSRGLTNAQFVVGMASR